MAAHCHCRGTRAADRLPNAPALRYDHARRWHASRSASFHALPTASDAQRYEVDDACNPGFRRCRRACAAGYRTRIIQVGRRAR